MNRDPFYRKIIQRLNGSLDPELFEECAADLLRSAWPTLVPIHGGSDSGMDGAVADAQGEPFPIITTAGDDVIGNLARNLNTYVRDGGQRRKAILATSQKLTPRRRQNLLKRARELGFTLLQIHDQDDFAHRLYHSSKWCRELLGLTGDPAPLSRIPRSERVFVELPLIGRDNELTWLRETSGDRLLVGQPGTGKTFLLRHFADLGEALFVNTRDRGAIAEGIRDQQPAAIIVDDAQLYRDVITNLKQLRNEIGAKFDIVACCWPGDERSIAAVLNVPAAQIHSLELLPRDTIVQIIQAAGIIGPNRLVREIVDQAEGRPGLAVTLVHLCLQGDVRPVLLGEALAGSLRDLDNRAIAILACFSIGGDAGMERIAIANALGIPDLEVREVVTRIGPGGIVREVDDRYLAVRPPALREVLVRDVFFRGPNSLDFNSPISRAPSLDQVVVTLIGARRRDASIPDQLLTQLLDRCNSPQAWQDYAWLGRDEALWVFNNCSMPSKEVLVPVLYYAPEVAVPQLLERAIGDNRPIHSNLDHPLRLVQDWIKGARPGTGGAVSRRQTLFDIASDWLRSGKDQGVGLLALTLSFFPSYEFGEDDPGEGTHVTIHFGPLALPQLEALQSRWSDALAVLRSIQLENTSPLSDLVHGYAYPTAHGHPVPSETYHAMRDFARHMVVDLASAFSERPDIVHWIKPFAAHLGLELDVAIDPAFEILYPTQDYRDWQKEQELSKQRVDTLASDWAQLSPEIVAEKLALIERLARRANAGWSEWPSYLCELMAAQVRSPLHWARALADATNDTQFVLPFLSSGEMNEPGWIEFAVQCLGNPNLRYATVYTVLTHPQPPQSLLNNTLANLEGYGKAIEMLTVRNEIPQTTLSLLLQHPDPAIASGAAKGEWLRDPQGNVREALHGEWRNAILRFSANEDHWLRQILISDPSLAFAWFERHIAELRSGVMESESNVIGAVAVLDNEARIKLLVEMPDSPSLDDIVYALVDDRLDVYRWLLQSERLRRYQLVPLGGEMQGQWVEKAKMALDAGYSVEQVAAAVQDYPGFLFWSGDESQMWSRWIARYSGLCADPDPRIRRIGEKGHIHAEEQRQRALGRERREVIFGRH
jgi:hypothetical protein